MPDTYSQLYIQLVFAVKHRQNFIQASWKNDLYKYIIAVIQNKRHKVLSINGMPDHIHIFIGLNPAISIADVVSDIKKASNNWINDKGFTQRKFAWQSGYGAFSYSRSHISKVCAYIENQEIHHQKITFDEAYTQFFNNYNFDDL